MEMELVSKFTEYGLLGINLGLLCLITMYLWRDLRASWVARLEETKQIIRVIDTTNQTYATLASSIADRARATEALAETQAMAVKMMSNQIESIKQSQNNVLVELEKAERQRDQLRKMLE